MKMDVSKALEEIRAAGIQAAPTAEAAEPKAVVVEEFAAGSVAQSGAAEILPVQDGPAKAELQRTEELGGRISWHSADCRNGIKIVSDDGRWTVRMAPPLSSEWNLYRDRGAADYPAFESQHARLEEAMQAAQAFVYEEMGYGP